LSFIIKIAREVKSKGDKYAFPTKKQHDEEQQCIFYSYDQPKQDAE